MGSVSPASEGSTTLGNNGRRLPPLDHMTGKAGRGKVTKYDENTGHVTLVIQDLGPGDEGQYECRADNPYGDSTCTITINPEVTKKRVVLPKGSVRPKLKACHIDSDDYADYADYASVKGL